MIVPVSPNPCGTVVQEEIIRSKSSMAALLTVNLRIYYTPGKALTTPL